MILGIESSTTHASLALLDQSSGKIVWQSDFVSERAHNAVIFEPVQQVLDEHREHLTGIVVGLGPGSYGGVRVAISIANGISLVLGIPCLGVSSLAAWEVEEEFYHVLGDARRKTTFVASVEGGALQGEPELLGEDEIEKRVGLFEREGAVLVTADPSVSKRFPSVALSYPHASRLLNGGEILDPTSWDKTKPLEPHYLRAPYITTPKKKKIG